MTRIDTEVLVIGGGATGTGVLRDLAMRGFKTMLVEKGDLTQGTTGRYHGLLHSGGRYVVKDPHAARECIEENRILRKIMPHCIEDTSGFFVLTPWDDPGYIDPFIAGCRNAGIPFEEVPLSQMWKEEPFLSREISKCFRLPDGSADSFLATDCNVASAREYGAEWLNYHKVIDLIQEDQRVVGIRCIDLLVGEKKEIHADMIINASGAWSGQIARMAGITVTVVSGKGTMLATNHRIVNTVINRCKMPSDGDLIVPIHTVAVIGTTDVKVPDPDHFSIEPWEVRMMLEEGEKLVPGFKEMRMLRAWAGVRPLYQQEKVKDTRQISRAFALIDHETRDGVSGIITITGGKWTTYRRMAEEAVDLTCKKLQVDRPCRSHLEPLPDIRQQKMTFTAQKPDSIHKHASLGERLENVEATQSYGALVCECELASLEEVIQAIIVNRAKSIDDIRRETRLGMGPCQGGFCTYRAAGLLHQHRQLPVEETNTALRDFLTERWKGQLPILWGQQLRQARLDELIYFNLLNASRLPGPVTSAISPEPYEHPSQPAMAEPSPKSSLKIQFIENDSDDLAGKIDLLVIGGGLSGLTAAWRAVGRGKRTQVFTKGESSLFWKTGCIDIIGFYPSTQVTPSRSPVEALRRLIEDSPEHPYSFLGLDVIEEAIGAFQDLCAEAGYPMLGSLESNWLLPTSLGTGHPTCLAPKTMTAGDLRSSEPMMIIGFMGYLDFFADFITANLRAQKIPARALNIESLTLRRRKFINGRALADLFETREFQDEIISTIRNNLRLGNERAPGRIGFPAVLGLNHPLEVQGILEEALGIPVFEIPNLPPSIPGMRLSKLLIRAIQAGGGHLYQGMHAEMGVSSANRLLEGVWTEAAERRKLHRARNFILATGGILGGGLQTNYEGEISESVFGLPLDTPETQTKWFDQKFMTEKGHPIFNAGIRVNRQLQPINHENQVCYQNVFVTGSTLKGGSHLQEFALDGVSLATGYFAGNII